MVIKGIRVIVGVMALIMTFFSVYILKEGIAINTLSNWFLFGGIALAFASLTLSSFAFKKLSGKQWVKSILSTFLLFFSMTFIAMFIDHDYAFKYLVSSVYMMSLSVIYLLFNLCEQPSRDKQSQWVGVFIFMTAVMVSFGFIDSIVSGAMIFIVLLLILIFYVYPRTTQKKFALLHEGEHDKLRKRLLPRYLPVDVVLMANSHFYKAEWSLLEQDLKLMSVMANRNKHATQYLDYIKAHFKILMAFYQGDKKDAIPAFEEMKAIGKKLFKSGYPMTSSYYLMYFMGAYEDEGTFLEAIQKEVAFSKTFDYGKQPEGFYKALTFEYNLYEAATQYIKTGAIEPLNLVLEQSVQPIYKEFFLETLQKYHQ